MILNRPHTSMGDEIMLTGLPEMLYGITGERTFLDFKFRPELWINNPYITDQPNGKTFNPPANHPGDYMIYYPVRLFYDLTAVVLGQAHIANWLDVAPNLYYEPMERDYNLVVLNDQSGWPARRGYPHWKDLISKLAGRGYELTYLKSPNYRDCTGEVHGNLEDYGLPVIANDDLGKTINLLRRCGLYTGYDSGLSQLAGALSCPYIYITGSVAPVNTIHPSCVYWTELPGCRRCSTADCDRHCLLAAPNYNDFIIEAVEIYP